VLRPGGWVAVAWNNGASQETAFAQALWALRQTFAQLYTLSFSPPLSAGLDGLFEAGIPRHASFPHTQHFDLAGLLGRIRSSGYSPQPDVPDYEEFTVQLTELFKHHQQDGTVVFHYMAQLYVGQLKL